MCDVIVVGNGPAGISAAIYLQRSNQSVLVLGKDTGALEYAKMVENYYGFPGGISGKELVARGLQQAQDLGISIVNDEVVAIAKEELFTVKTATQSYQSRALILATGKARNTPNISGLSALMGKGVSQCAICDGFFYRGKRLAVLGNGSYAVSEAGELLHFTRDITIYTNGLPMTVEVPDPAVGVVETPIIQVEGENAVEALLLQNGERHPVDGIFVAVGTASSADFALKLGLLMEKNNILTDENKRTNLPGLYAVGDCTGGLLQVCKAVTDGALAARAIVSEMAHK